MAFAAPAAATGTGTVATPALPLLASGQVLEYELCARKDRNVGTPHEGKIDVKVLTQGGESSHLAMNFKSDWDNDDDVLAQEARRRGDLVRSRFQLQQPAGYRYPQGHRVVFDTDGHYSRMYNAFMHTSFVITGITSNILLLASLGTPWTDELIKKVSALYNNTTSGHNDTEPCPNGNEQFGALPVWVREAYFFVVMVSLLLFFTYSLLMTRAVIKHDRKYYGNFFHDAQNGWSCPGIACIMVKSLCLTLSPCEEAMRRSFNLWKSIFAMCAFGISKDVMDIITILHPEKAEARCWPCFANRHSTPGVDHRIWMHWDPGSFEEYSFENDGVKRNSFPLLVAMWVTFAVNFYILTKVRTFLAAWATLNALYNAVTECKTIMDIECYKSTFRNIQKFNSADPLERERAERNREIYRL